MGKAPPPPLFNARQNSGLRATPAPPYGHAVEHDIPRTMPEQVRPAPVARAPSVPSRRQPAASSPAGGQAWKPFSQYDGQDKQDFFGALDAFFGATLGPALTATSPAPASAPDANPYRSAMRSQPPAAAEPTPPPVSLSTRPALSSAYSSSAPTHTASSRSYPRAETHSSAALSLLHYILHSTFPTPWYSTSSPMPPPLVGRSDLRVSFSMSQLGSRKETTGVCLFGDCSIAWWRIAWDISRPQDATHEGRYRPIPEPWTGDRLYAAGETYGPHIAEFARQAVRSRRPVARGECWDVAAEALNAVPKELPAPFPALGRTHGHLLYYARAGNDGTWRGGDSYVREGDIVEWREVRIDAGNGWAKLGDPEVSRRCLSFTLAQRHG